MNDADAAVFDGGFDVERAAKFGAGVVFGFADVARQEVASGGDSGVCLCFHFRGEGRGEVFQPEIDAGVVDADLGAGDPTVVVVNGGGVQDVEDGVVGGKRLAAGGVDAELDGCAGGEIGRRGGAGVVPEDTGGGVEAVGVVEV